MSEAQVQAIRERLQALRPDQLEVVDEGHLHVGHAGEGQGHYRVRIRSAAFGGRTPLQRHRMVYAAVADLIGHGIHALAIEASLPDEGGS